MKKLGIVPGARWFVDARPKGWSFEIAPTLRRLEQSIFPAGPLWIRLVGAEAGLA